MKIWYHNEEVNVPDGTGVLSAVRLLSPFGEEPVVVLLNGMRVDVDADAKLKEGDALAIFPLLIGG